MSRRIRTPCVPWLVVACLLTSQQGCSYVGYTIGEKHHPLAVVTTGPGCPAYEKGTQLELQLIDGRSVHGVYLGRQYRPADTYRRLYANFVDAFAPELKSFVPGDTVAVTLTNGESAHVRFLGLDHAVSSSRDHPSKTLHDLTVVIQSPYQTDPLELSAGSIQEIETLSGTSLPKAALDRLGSMQNVPSLTTISIRESLRTRSIALDSLSSVRAQDPSDARWVGLAAGTSVDLAVIGIVVFVIIAGAALAAAWPDWR